MAELHEIINSRTAQVIFVIVCLLVFIIAIIVGFVILQNYLHRRAKEIVQKKCEEYVKFACDLQQPKTEGKLSGIVAGEDASVGVFPHMASLIIIPKNDPNWETNSGICGGSLISEYFVLSAAHCVSKVGDLVVPVKLGSVITAVFLNDSTGELFSARDIFIHPTYVSSGGNPWYDIMLLKLNRKVEFNLNMRPICLNSIFNADNYSSVIVAGWGLTEISKTSNAKHLQYAELRTDGEIIKTRCAQWYSKSRVPPSGQRLLMCAGSPTTIKTPNYGDSGGPTMIPLNDKCSNVYEQIAIITGIDNNTEVGNIAQLSFHLVLEPFIYWIASTVWEDEF